MSESATCPECNFEFPPDLNINYCIHCGKALSPLLQTDVDELLSKERRTVTILFASIVGYEAALDSLDPEEVEQMLNPLLRKLSTGIREEGGSVDKLMGETLMATFGAPETHEDDPQRAISAGLRLRNIISTYRREHPEQKKLFIRIGINTGDVIWGHKPGDRKTVLGDQVNIAKRLEETADPMTIQVSRSTRDLVKHRFRFGKQREISPKGSEQTIQTFQVTEEIQSTSPGKGRNTIESKLIGRERELDRLIKNLEMVNNNSQPSFVLITGSPGVGKSRLVEELTNHLRKNDSTFQVQKGSCHSTGQISFSPLRGMFQERIDLSQQGEPPELRTRLANALEEDFKHIDLSKTELKNWTHLIGDAIGLPFPVEEKTIHHLDPEDQRNELFIALQNWINSLTETNPLLWIIEDLHHASPGMLELLNHLATSLEDSPFAVIATARGEEMQNKHEEPFKKAGRETRIRLESLTRDDTEEIVTSALGAPPDDTLVEVLNERAAGNPYFIEELLRYLLEANYVTPKRIEEEFAYTLATPEKARESIPKKTRAVLAARIDRLPRQDRKVTQTASVIGQTFWEKCVSDILGVDIDSSLQELKEREFITDHPETLINQQIEYEFKHVLIKDVAYNQLLEKHRKELHGRVADWLTEHVETPSHQTEALRAYNLDRSGRLEEAAQVYRNAGDLAINTSAAPQAINYYHRTYEITGDPNDLDKKINALKKSGKTQSVLTGLNKLLEILEKNDVDSPEGTAKRINARRRKGDCLRLLGDIEAAETEFKEALKIYENSTSTIRNTEKVVTQQIKFLMKYSWLIGEIKGNIDQARIWIDRAESLFQSQNFSSDREKEIRAEMDVNQGVYDMRQGNIDRAIERFQRCLQIRKTQEQEAETASILNNLGLAHLKKGAFNQALSNFKDAYEICQKTGQRSMMGQTTTNAGLAYLHIGELNNALEYFETSLKITRETQNKRSMGKALSNIGVIHLRKGNLEEALQCFERKLNISRELNDREGIGLARCYIGLVQGRRGNLDQAIDNLDRYREICEETENLQGVGLASLNRGNIYRDMGRLKSAKSCFETYRDISEQIGDRGGIGKSMSMIGWVLYQLDDPAGAEPLLKEGLEILEEINFHKDIIHSLSRLAEFYSSENKFDKAIDLTNKAISKTEQTGIKIGPDGLASVKSKKGSLFRRMDETDKAIEHHQVALELCKHNEAASREIANCHLELALDYISAREKEDASKHLNSAREHIKNTEILMLQKALEEARIKFEFLFGSPDQAEEKARALIKEWESRSYYRNAERLREWLQNHK